MSTRRFVPAALGFVLVVLMGDPAAAASGVLDPSFGVGGRVEVLIARSSAAEALALMPDGRIVTAGWAQNSVYDAGFAAARLLPDGALDTSFSGDGMIRVGFAGEAWASDIVVQRSGKVVMAGHVYLPGPEPGYGTAKVALVRLLSDGSLDPRFSGDGKVLTGFSGGAGAAAIVQQPDSRFVVAGEATSLDSQQRSMVARYLPNGLLDQSFGKGGKVLGPTGSRATDVAVLPDGKIVVTGTWGDDLMVARYLPDGRIDRSFGVDGITTTPSTFASFGQIQANALIVLPSGHLVVVGGDEGYRSECDAVGMPFIARYLADGSLDPAFGVRRINPTAPDRCPYDEFQSVARRVGGGLVAVGYGPLLMVGMHPLGALDADFGTGGIIRDTWDTSDRGFLGAWDVAVQGDGAIVAAGAISRTDSSIVVTRYLDD
jgi:uncharacterized delta-60 repeat protein